MKTQRERRPFGSQEISRENCQHLNLRHIFIKGLATLSKEEGRVFGKKELIMSPSASLSVLWPSLS